MNKQELKDFARKNWVPILRDKSADFLCKVIKDQQPKTILEIGTCLGYSGTLMLENSSAFLTTIEKDEKKCEQAAGNFKQAGLEERVKVICGDAGEVIEKLEAEGNKYDFIFLDGPKGQYLFYLPHLKKMLNKGGILMADDIYYHGWVKGNDYPKHKHRTIILRLREFIEKITTDEDFDTILLDLEDGISLSCLK